MLGAGHSGAERGRDTGGSSNGSRPPPGATLPIQAPITEDFQVELQVRRSYPLSCSSAVSSAWVSAVAHLCSAASSMSIHNQGMEQQLAVTTINVTLMCIYTDILTRGGRCRRRSDAGQEYAEDEPHARLCWPVFHGRRLPKHAVRGRIAHPQVRSWYQSHTRSVRGSADSSITIPADAHPNTKVGGASARRPQRDLRVRAAGSQGVCGHRAYGLLCASSCPKTGLGAGYFCIGQGPA